MSLVMTGGRPLCLPLRAAVSSPSSVDSRMCSRSVFALAAQNANSGFGTSDLVSRIGCA